MKSKILLNIFLVLFMATYSYGQIDQSTIEASIIVTDHISDEPLPGTIKWNGMDFQGWNGLIWVSLTGNSVVGSVTDIDNNVYKTVRIGNQIWITENLRAEHLNDGTYILAKGQQGLPGSSIGFRYYYDDNKSSYEDDFGALYSWNVVNTGKLCPTGFHIPHHNEWIKLSNYLGSNIGIKLKANDDLWESSLVGGTNEIGFSGVPGGFLDKDGNYVEIYQTGKIWTSNMPDANNNNYITTVELFYSNTGLNKVLEPSNIAASVRCVK